MARSSLRSPPGAAPRAASNSSSGSWRRPASTASYSACGPLVETGDATTTRSGWGRSIARGALLLTALACGACTGDLNATNDLLDAPPLPALAGPLSAEELATARADLAAGEPLVSLDRRNWAPVAISVPRGQVEYQPTYWTELMPDRSTARARGEFPGAGTALEGDGEAGSVALEAGTNLASTPLFLFWAPVEMVVEGNWPWTTLRNRPDYARVPPPVTRDDWAWVASRGDGGAMGAPVPDPISPFAPASASATPASSVAAPAPAPTSGPGPRPGAMPSPE